MALTALDKGKGKARAEDEQLRNDAGSDNEMDVDNSGQTSRERFLRGEKGKANKGDLFEVPTRNDGKGQNVYHDIRLTWV